ncbi:hypothetical protein HanPI659440_Chr06g0250251 [Helianthus annuus]|nr:hypothetical protein HanPI659440_Chr06g0250251 [Helianthus annuus]
MAPKERKRKPATKKENKTEEEIMSEKRHNQVAYLDPEEKLAELKDITKWIRESRINYAVTFSTPVYKSLVKAFSNTASVGQVDGKEVISGRVENVDMIVSPDILNEVLQLKDSPDAPVSVPILCIRGCLLRMKCTGDILSMQINKGDLPLRYKFLLHVLIQCLSNKRAGYDMASNELMGLMVALVLNRPFSISRFIFENMKENMTRTGKNKTIGSKYWMYPRYLQMIKNVQHPNLPKVDNDVLKIEAMNFHSLRLIKNMANKRYKESVPPRKLLGALGNTAYVAPADNKWRHEDSQSDNEEPELKRMMSEKFGPEPVVSDESDSDDDGDEGGNGSDAGVVGASSVGTTGGTSAGGTSAGGVSAGDTSAGGDDEADSDSDDDLLLEPGYEMYLDERGVRRYRRIRQEDDPEYVPSDPETVSARKRKAEKASKHYKKKKARKYLSTSSRGSAPQAPIPEPPVISSPPAAQTVSPQTIPQRSMAASIRATTAGSSVERQRIFTDMTQDEKNNYLFLQFEAAADRIKRQTDFIHITKRDQLSQLVEIERLKTAVGAQQATIQQQQAEIDLLKAENERMKASEAERDRRSSILQNWLKT